MKKSIILLMLIIIIFVCGCHKVYGNDRSQLEVLDEENIYFEINTFPRSSLDNINNDDRLSGLLSSIYMYLGIEKGYITGTGEIAKNNQEYIYGFFNVYDDCVGYLSGGGNVGVEEINAGYLYSYSITEKKLNIIEKLNKSSIIGYHTKYIVYWVNKNFYYKETGQEDSTFIIEDEAFDSGFTHYSYVRFKKYKESFEIFMHVDKGVLFPECYEKVVTIDWNTLNIKII